MWHKYPSTVVNSGIVFMLHSFSISSIAPGVFVVVEGGWGWGVGGGGRVGGGGGRRPLEL